MSYFIGIDIGTQGVRVVLLDAEGNSCGSAEQSFQLDSFSRMEQSPDVWWDLCLLCLKELVSAAGQNHDLSQVLALSVTSTSGTVIPLDQFNQPIYKAIMYSDSRSDLQAKKATDAARLHHPDGYNAFGTSSGLAKILWFRESFPDDNERLYRWVHAADYITGKLSNVWGITDYTNAFKSGYDVNHLEWPEYLFTVLGLQRSWLPEVVPSGQVIGKIQPDIARSVGLPEYIQVTAGITDGCASQIASGAVEPGDWNTTIGTTMVIKGVTIKEIIDPQGRIYSHRHPSGYWMPGGASNTGADWVSAQFGQDLAELNEAAAQLIPTGYIAYPLLQNGERFPFVCASARGFEPSGLSRAQNFAAKMEGVAFLERYAFELIEELSGEAVRTIYTAGGASNSDTWLTIRTNVLNRPIHKMKHASGAIGAAILAASSTLFSSISEAAKALTRVDKTVLPEPALVEQYNHQYQQFIQELTQKGYLPKTSIHA